MSDRRWILNSTQDWVDYVDKNGVLLGSIGPLMLGGVRACTYRPSLGWPLRYDKYIDFSTDEAARAWVEDEIGGRPLVEAEQPSIMPGSADLP